MAVLFYESPNASVAALSRLAEQCLRGCDYTSENPIYEGDSRNLKWIDNSPKLQELCSSYYGDQINFQCATPPFASSQSVEGTNFSVLAFFRGGLEESSQSKIESIFSIAYTPIKNSEDPDIQVLCKYR